MDKVQKEISKIDEKIRSDIDEPVSLSFMKDYYSDVPISSYSSRLLPRQSSNQLSRIMDMKQPIIPQHTGYTNQFLDQTFNNRLMHPQQHRHYDNHSLMQDYGIYPGHLSGQNPTILRHQLLNKDVDMLSRQLLQLRDRSSSHFNVQEKTLDKRVEELQEHDESNLKYKEEISKQKEEIAKINKRSVDLALQIEEIKKQSKDQISEQEQLRIKSLNDEIKQLENKEKTKQQSIEALAVSVETKEKLKEDLTREIKDLERTKANKEELLKKDVDKLVKQINVKMNESEILEKKLQDLQKTEDKKQKAKLIKILKDKESKFTVKEELDSKEVSSEKYNKLVANYNRLQNILDDIKKTGSYLTRYKTDGSPSIEIIDTSLFSNAIYRFEPSIAIDKILQFANNLINITQSGGKINTEYSKELSKINLSLQKLYKKLDSNINSISDYPNTEIILGQIYYIQDLIDNKTNNINSNLRKNIDTNIENYTTSLQILENLVNQIASISNNKLKSKKTIKYTESEIDKYIELIDYSGI